MADGLRAAADATASAFHLLLSPATFVACAPLIAKMINPFWFLTLVAVVKFHFHSLSQPCKFYIAFDNLLIMNILLHAINLQAWICDNEDCFKIHLF